MTININPYLLPILVKKGLVREFCHFIKYKYLYRSSCLIDAKVYQVARAARIDVKTVRKYLCRMVEHDWIRQEHGHFVFKNIADVSLASGVDTNKIYLVEQIELSPQDTIEDIKIKLLSLLIKREAEKQTYAAKSRNDSGLFPNDVGDSDVRLSCSKIGSLLSLKKSSGCYLKKKLSALGLAGFRSNIEMLARCSSVELAKEMSTLFSGHVWRFKNMIFRQNCDSLLIPSAFIKLNAIY